MLFQGYSSSCTNRMKHTFTVRRLQFDGAFLPIGQHDGNIDLQIVDDLRCIVVDLQARHAVAENHRILSTCDVDAIGSERGRSSKKQTKACGHPERSEGPLT